MKHHICSKLLTIVIPCLSFELLIDVNTNIQAAFNEKLHGLSSEITVVKDPVIEMNNSFPPPHHPAASPDVKSCPRAHQGLYNELVDRIEKKGDCVKIAYNNIVYGFDAETKKVLNTFWTYKKHLIPLKELTDDILQTIPHPHYAQELTIVLTYPWQTFSVGTRFKHMPEHDTASAYAIVRADFTANIVVVDLVPHDNAIAEIQQDPHMARELFVKIINDLVDRVAQSGQDNIIPYVWGGSSFLQPYIRSAFYQKDGTWQREGVADPYTGYDCSEFVMRMAKIAGIEFPWKTTTTIQRARRELNVQDNLEEGDLIWVQSHVMIVSNIERNEIIESRGYGAGYGCVHRIKLHECIDGIATYDDLLERYYRNQTIKFKDKQGKPADKSNVFKLLKLID